MPKYQYRNKKTGEVWEEEREYSERNKNLPEDVELIVHEINGCPHIRANDSSRRIGNYDKFYRNHIEPSVKANKYPEEKLRFGKTGGI
jgi:hypothetical protein